MTDVDYLEAVKEAQIEEMKRDENIVLMGQDLRASLYGGTGLLDLFGEDRVRDLPTSETACVGAAIGMSMTGLRPWIDMGMSSFCFVAFDQFISQLAKVRYVSGGLMKVPVTIRIPLMYDNAVGVQHSDRIHPLLMQIPGLKIAMPTTPGDAKAMLKTALRDDDPVIFLEDSYCWAAKGPVGGPDDTAEVGKAQVRREGSDVTVVAIGRMVAFALDAADVLAGEGISAEVIDLCWMSPLDWDTIFASVAKTGALVAVDPAGRTCSAASEIAATVNEQCYGALRGPARRVTSPNVHSPYTPALEKFIYPDVGKIAAVVRAAVSGA
jgi:acetoin:2,6-dichlorophenolindophenol oxidoreductase subunit beta